MSERADVTPQPRRRLGLRLPKGASTPGVRRQLTQPTKTPHSEENNRNNDTEAVETPRACAQKPKANSTNCKRLGLTRRRTDLSKKRLEFVAQSEKSEVAVTTETTESPQKSEWRQRQIVELESDIEIWKNVFKAALGDLQTLKPDVPEETMLAQLHIPLEMLRYLEED